MSNCTMGLFWETIFDPITSEKSNRFLQSNLIVQFNITVGGGAGGREPGRLGGGRGTGDGRRKDGKREAGSGKRERISKRQAFDLCYCLSSSQRNEPNNVF